MPTTVAVISAGNMGAGVGQRLVERGAQVCTWLEGRGAATIERARRAGMRPVELNEIAGKEFLLSIVPPGDAEALAERLAPVLAASTTKPTYIDCNAVSPPTVARIAARIATTGCRFVDGGIIGGPPTPDGKSPVLYVSGSAAPTVTALGEYGLDVRVLTGDIGAASALKMSYAGITKGFTALGAVMALAATHAGADAALHRELADSQPELLAWLSRQVPRMYSKAYRWVAEMEEIAGFIDDPSAGSRILEGAAGLYRRLADDQTETEALTAFFNRTEQN